MWVILLEGFYCYLAQVFFPRFEKNKRFLLVYLDQFRWLFKIMWRIKRGRPPSTALDLRPAFPVIKLTIGLYLPNVGLMLAQCRRRWTNNKVTLGECIRY